MGFSFEYGYGKTIVLFQFGKAQKVKILAKKWRIYKTKSLFEVNFGHTFSSYTHNGCEARRKVQKIPFP